MSFCGALDLIFPGHALQRKGRCEEGKGEELPELTGSFDGKLKPCSAVKGTVRGSCHKGIKGWEKKSISLAQERLYTAFGSLKSDVENAQLNPAILLLFNFSSKTKGC